MGDVEEFFIVTALGHSGFRSCSAGLRRTELSLFCWNWDGLYYCLIIFMSYLVCLKIVALAQDLSHTWSAFEIVQS